MGDDGKGFDAAQGMRYRRGTQHRRRRGPEQGRADDTRSQRPVVCPAAHALYQPAAHAPGPGHRHGPASSCPAASPTLVPALRRSAGLAISPGQTGKGVGPRRRWLRPVTRFAMYPGEGKPLLAREVFPSPRPPIPSPARFIQKYVALRLLCRFPFGNRPPETPLLFLQYDV